MKLFYRYVFLNIFLILTLFCRWNIYFWIALFFSCEENNQQSNICFDWVFSVPVYIVYNNKNISKVKWNMQNGYHQNSCISSLILRHLVSLAILQHFLIFTFKINVTVAFRRNYSLKFIHRSEKKLNTSYNCIIFSIFPKKALFYDF